MNPHDDRLMTKDSFTAASDDAPLHLHALAGCGFQQLRHLNAALGRYIHRDGLHNGRAGWFSY